MSATTKPFDFYMAVHKPKFWQDHVFSEDPKGAQLRYAKKKPDHADESSDTCRDLLVRHLQQSSQSVSTSYLLKASANIVQVNRYLLQANPIPYAVLLQAPQCYKATAHVTRMMKGIEARDAKSAASILNASQDFVNRASVKSDIEARNMLYFSTFEKDITRVRRKYEHLDPWTKSCVALAHHALEAAARTITWTTMEREDWRQLHTQMQHSLRAANRDLCIFEEIGTRMAPSLQSFRSIDEGSDEYRGPLPVTVPDLLFGGTLFLQTPSDCIFFKDLFTQLADAIESVRLQHLEGRIADLTEARHTLSQALFRSERFLPCPDVRSTRVDDKKSE